MGTPEQFQQPSKSRIQIRPCTYCGEPAVITRPSAVEPVTWCEACFYRLVIEPGEHRMQIEAETRDLYQYDDGGDMPLERDGMSCETGRHPPRTGRLLRQLLRRWQAKCNGRALTIRRLCDEIHRLEIGQPPASNLQEDDPSSYTVRVWRAGEYVRHPGRGTDCHILARDVDLKEAFAIYKRMRQRLGCGILSVVETDTGAIVAVYGIRRAVATAQKPCPPSDHL